MMVILSHQLLHTGPHHWHWRNETAHGQTPNRTRNGGNSVKNTSGIQTSADVSDSIKYNALNVMWETFSYSE